LDISNILGSAIWLYFDKNPSYALGYNVCKKCSHRYKTTTGVSTLWKHLKKHQLQVPTKKHQVLIKKGVSFNDNDQKIHDKYLTNWLICDLQPFTVVETHHFKAFLNFFCPNYIIPDGRRQKVLIYCVKSLKDYI